MTATRDPALRYDELEISNRTTGTLLLTIVAARPPGMSDTTAQKNLQRMADYLYPGAAARVVDPLRDLCIARRLIDS